MSGRQFQPEAQGQRGAARLRNQAVLYGQRGFAESERIALLNSGISVRVNNFQKTAVCG